MALHHAVKKGQLEVVETLIRFGTDVNAVDRVCALARMQNNSVLLGKCMALKMLTDWPKCVLFSCLKLHVAY